MRSKAAAALLGLCALVILAGAIFGLWRTLRPSPKPTIVQASVGASTFTLQSRYVRPDSRDGGRLETLKLAAFFPDFTPAGDLNDIASDTDLAERYEKVVFITIAPADTALDPADRPIKLYARFLEPNEWSHPGGLIARSFTVGSPFEGEELYFVAPEGREFAARCSRPDQTRKTPNSCLYDYRDGDLNIQLRFSADLLAEWEKLSAGARGLLQQARGG